MGVSKIFIKKKKNDRLENNFYWSLSKNKEIHQDKINLMQIFFYEKILKFVSKGIEICIKIVRF